jgi:PAT family beta-lactamase induction signal transducer AmpG
LRPSFTEALAVYLQRRVLVVLLLGFSSGLPIVLVGATLQAWMKTSGIDVKTIGLFAAVALPYNIKFLWAPLVDALDVPFLAKAFGRRRAWLLLSQAWLIAAIALLGCCDPVTSAFLVAVARSSSLRPRRRKTSWSTPFASRACRRTSRPPAWLHMSPPTASAR